MALVVRHGLALAVRRIAAACRPPPRNAQDSEFEETWQFKIATAFFTVSVVLCFSVFANRVLYGPQDEPNSDPKNPNATMRLDFALVVMLFATVVVLRIRQYYGFYVIQPSHTQDSKVTPADCEDIGVLLHASDLADPCEVCAVCLDRFAPTDKVRELPCGHCFHAPCVDGWFLSQKSCLHLACPLCRTCVTPARAVWTTPPEAAESVSAFSAVTTPAPPREVDLESAQSA